MTTFEHGILFAASLSFQRNEQEFEMAANILVVEDDSSNRGLISKLLAKEGYQIVEASDGAQALGLWCGRGCLENKKPRGEIGILKAVERSQVLPPNRCFLYIDHEESSYIGCLLIDNHAFCDQIAKLLRSYLNRPIAEIGNLDLAHTL